MANHLPTGYPIAMENPKNGSKLMATVNFHMGNPRQKVAAFARENAKRRPCQACGNLVLPEKMDQHIRAFHDER